MPREIRIDPEFQAVIPPLLIEERRMLEDSIASEGVRDALSVWEVEGEDYSILLDGHNRHEIATRLGITYRTAAVPKVKSRDDAEEWIYVTQLGRRNLDALSRIELARRLEKVERKKAKDRQREHGGTAPGKGRTLVENSTQVSDAGKSRDSLAKKAGVSSFTYSRGCKVLAHGAPELVAAVKSRDVSVNAASFLADLPQEEQKRLVSEGPRALADKSRELRVVSKSTDSDLESSDETDADSTEPGQKKTPKPSARADVAELDERIRLAAERIESPSLIAKEVGCSVDKVYRARERLGFGKKQINALDSLTQQADSIACAWESMLSLTTERSSRSDEQSRSAAIDAMSRVVAAAKKTIRAISAAGTGERACKSN